MSALIISPRLAFLPPTNGPVNLLFRFAKIQDVNPFLFSLSDNSYAYKSLSGPLPRAGKGSYKVLSNYQCLKECLTLPAQHINQLSLDNRDDTGIAVDFA